MPDRERISVVALLTAREHARLGASFDRAWPVDETPCFGDLLRAIDEADRRFRQEPRDDPVATIRQPPPRP